MEQEKIFAKVETCTNLTALEMKISIEKRSTPVFLPAFCNEWDALRLWNDKNCLESLIENKSISVENYKDERYLWIERSHTEMPVVEFLEKLFGMNSGRPAYLADVSIACAKRFGLPKFPNFAKNICFPEFIPKKRFRTAGLFLGNSSTTQCHFHPISQALICQVIGKKTLFLIAPEAEYFLNPFPAMSKEMNWSQLQFSMNKIPDVLWNSPYNIYKVELSPGDSLFIPIHWWHSAHSEGLSASVTFFWDATIREVAKSPFPLRTLRYLRRDFSWMKSKLFHFLKKPCEPGDSNNLSFGIFNKIHGKVL